MNILGDIEKKATPGRSITDLFLSPDENNTLPYLQSLARLKDALEILTNAKLKATDRVTNQMVSRIA